MFYQSRREICGFSLGGCNSLTFLCQPMVNRKLVSVYRERPTPPPPNFRAGQSRALPCSDLKSVHTPEQNDALCFSAQRDQKGGVLERTLGGSRLAGCPCIILATPRDERTAACASQRLGRQPPPSLANSAIKLKDQQLQCLLIHNTVRQRARRMDAQLIIPGSARGTGMNGGVGLLLRVGGKRGAGYV